MIAHLRLKGKRFDPDEMQGDLYVAPAEGGESQRITNTPETEMDIAWTPDGRRLNV